MDSPAVVVIGGAMLDYHYPVTNLPEPDGGAFAPSSTVAFGGVGGNVAVALDRLGRDVGLISRVGRDDGGKRVSTHLDEEGVDTTRVRTGSEETTHSLVFRASDGQRMIVTAGESYSNLSFGDADRRYVADADAVVLTAYTPDAVVSAVLDAAASDPEFPPVVFDFSGPLPELEGRGTTRETVERALDTAALFVTGRVAADSLFTGDAQTVAERLSAAGAPRVAYTRGACGATLFADGERTEIDAFDVDTVDTTGAGDAFLAALVDRWVLAGDAPVEAGEFAAATAAINCRHEFTQPGLPTRAEVRSFLDDRREAAFSETV